MKEQLFFQRGTFLAKMGAWVAYSNLIKSSNSNIEIKPIHYLHISTKFYFLVQIIIFLRVNIIQLF